METESWKAIGTIIENIKSEISNIREKLSKSEDASVCLENIEKECDKLSAQAKEKTKKKTIRNSFQPHPPTYIPNWTKLMTARNETHWSMLRNEGLANLYVEWSSFSTPKLPKKFKKPQMYSDSQEENVIYRDQAVKQMVTEAEILVLRSRRNAETIKAIDRELSEALKKVRQSEIETSLKEMWTSSIKIAEGKNVSKWQKKKQWWVRTIKPITDSEGKNAKNKAKQQGNSSQLQQQYHHHQQQQHTSNYNHHRGPNRQRNPNSRQHNSRPSNNRGRHNRNDSFHNHASYEGNNYQQRNNYRNNRYSEMTNYSNNQYYGYNNNNNNNQYYTDYAGATKGDRRSQNRYGSSQGGNFPWDQAQYHQR